MINTVHYNIMTNKKFNLILDLILILLFFYACANRNNFIDKNRNHNKMNWSSNKSKIHLIKKMNVDLSPKKDSSVYYGIKKIHYYNLNCKCIKIIAYIKVTLYEYN